MSAFPESDQGAVSEAPDGRSRFIEFARDLLVLASELQELPEMTDVPALRLRILDQLKRFEHACRRESLGQERIMAARFALCAFLDERILLTPWGAASDWRTNPLTLELHSDRDPGRTFFALLEMLQPEPARFREVLELFCLILRLGFRGEFARFPGGDAHLAELTRVLGERLRDEVGGYSAPLSVDWAAHQLPRATRLADAPLWAWFSAGMVAVLLAAGALTLWMSARAEPLRRALIALGGG